MMLYVSVYHNYSLGYELLQRPKEKQKGLDRGIDLTGLDQHQKLMQSFKQT
jgi:hypothetical protein